MTVKDLVEILKNKDDEMEVRIVSQYDSFTGDKYHNEINDVYIGVEDGQEDVVVLESDVM